MTKTGFSLLSGLTAALLITAAGLSREDMPAFMLTFEKDSLPASFQLRENAAISSVDRSGGQVLVGTGTRQERTYHLLASVPDVPLESGRFYQLTARIRYSSTVNKKGIVVRVVFPGQKSDALNQWSRNAQIKKGLFDGSADTWLAGEHVFMVPPGYRTGTVELGSYLAKGETVFFDDIALKLLPPRVETDYTCFCTDQKVEVLVNTASLPGGNQSSGFSGNIVFREKKSGRIHPATEIARFDTALQTIACSMEGLPEGPYEIKTTVRAAGGRAWIKTQDFEIFRHPYWENNSLGILRPEEDVPAPWTNLLTGVSGGHAGFFGGPDQALEETPPEPNMVECWERRYVFGPPFPKDIRVFNEPVLSGPIFCLIETGRGAVAWDKCRWECLEKGKQKAVFAFSNRQTDITVSGTVECEFDGMIKYAVQLTPDEGTTATINRLTLTIPMKEEYSRLLYCPLLQGFRYRSEADRGEEWHLKEFQPLLVVGNETRGLAWFAESDEGWNVRDDYFSCVGGPAGRVWEINLITRPTSLTGAREFVFGLQATPTRPRPDGWRGLNFRTPVQQNMEIHWSTPDTARYFGFPAEAESRSLTRAVSEGRKNGITRHSFYLTPQYCAETMPEWRYYRQEWRLEPWVGDPTTFTPISAVDVRNKRFQDFLVQKAYDFLKDGPADGFYYDGGGALKCGDKRWNIFSSRELFKRLYIVQRRLRPTGFIIIHQGTFVPVDSFGDFSLTGEQYRRWLDKSYDYLSFLTLKQFRQEAVMDFGQVRMLLGQYRGPYMEQAAPGVHFMGLALLHDLMVYPGLTHKPSYDDIERRLLAFGKADASFNPYWEGGGRVVAPDPSLKISYYQKPNGTLFAVVFNTSNAAVDTTVKVDCAGLNLARPSATVYYPLAGREVAGLPPGRIPAVIEPHSVVLVEVR